ncbi:MAG: MFS transporter [Gammaproteobacteria bacterium]|nr:MAG: MFS transporter [Gammaproteobacteria bacterium]
MTAAERRATAALAGIYALRMLGLFLILPVFALYAREHLAGATPILIGLAIGAYGLTQALLQIPFGMLSDRFGRKPVIIGGLLVFALGSVVAALSDSIAGVIIGRALQGSGAIAAAVMALAADLTRDEQRTKVMAAIGTTIGLSFALALVMGPVLDNWIGVPGIFWLTAVLALGGIALLRLGVPQPVESRFHRETEAAPGQMKAVLSNPALLRLNGGVLILHLLLTASFVALPFALNDVAGLVPGRHWHVYLPVVLLAMAVMVPFVLVAEKKRRMKEVFLAAIVLLVVAEAGLGVFHQSAWVIGVLLFVFFTGFNVLEATLPSWISKIAPAANRGTAMGAFSTAQFIGAFLGGVAGGYLYESGGLSAVFLFCALMAAVWLVFMFNMPAPAYLKNRQLRVGKVDTDEAQHLAARLRTVPGVAEAVVVAEEGMAYLKVDTQVLNDSVLLECAVSKA